ncbi:tonB-system energizer ExbB [Acinetobacter guillouiae]|uniref:Biopolymer transport protein ExbB n=1 Tax=Acinetobacter guillouiae TaxID=106649 RepID=A0A8X8KEF7_ACIGI|nr:tonB-system energizer ExbB [Acinetobacter guillouiae]MCF0263861.1 tonB-system energizer ExbB [Acinetobacter guillouiae]
MLSYFSSIKRILNKFLFFVIICTSNGFALAAELPITHVVSLSPLTLFQEADIVVKIVMIILGLLSITSWIVWLAKTYALRTHKLNLINSIQYIQKKKTIDEHFEIKDPATHIVQKVAYDEYQTIKSKTFILESSVKDRVGFQIERILENEKSRLSQGSNFLATIGSVAPFIGLFGTVWGIMHSFVAIAETNVSNLSVVAPGIAEALFATALGLVAAIPAVILYNNIIRQISHHGLLLEDASTLILCLFGRDVDSLQEQNILFNQHKVK